MLSTPRWQDFPHLHAWTATSSLSDSDAMLPLQIVLSHVVLFSPAVLQMAEPAAKGRTPPCGVLRVQQAKEIQLLNNRCTSASLNKP